MLTFTNKNVKLDKLAKLTGKKVFSFSLLSGWTCPFAKECHSKVIKVDGKSRIKDGPHTLFRCFSASGEALYPNVYNSRKRNTDAIKACTSKKQIVTLLQDALPTKAKNNIVRIHVGGDFFNQRYFDAWLQLTKDNPNTIFYAYTKSLPFWIKRMNDIAVNLVLTASYGGYQDKLIEKHNLRFAKVVFSVEEAKKLKLDLDFDDHHAYDPDKKDVSFALLIHGMQPKAK